MSVKIIRKEEQRTTSLRDFLLVAILPLLLTGVLGFLLGSTRAGDADRTAAALAEVRQERDQLRTELTGLDGYLTLVDSLQEALAADIVELHDDRRSAFTAPTTAIGDDPVAEWWRKVTTVQREYQVELAGITGELEADRVLTRKQIGRLRDLFTAYNEAANQNFSTYKSARERYGATQNTCDTEIEDLKEEHRKEVADLRRKLDRDADKIDDLNTDKQNLTAQLANTGKTVCPDNSSPKSSIKDAVSEIVAVVEGLDTRGGFLKLNRKDLEEVKAAQIKVKQLGQEIRDQASEIQ